MNQRLKQIQKLTLQWRQCRSASRSKMGMKMIHPKNRIVIVQDQILLPCNYYTHNASQSQGSIRYLKILNLKHTDLQLKRNQHHIELKMSRKNNLKQLQRIWNMFSIKKLSRPFLCFCMIQKRRDQNVIRSSSQLQYLIISLRRQSIEHTTILLLLCDQIAFYNMGRQ